MICVASKEVLNDQTKVEKPSDVSDLVQNRSKEAVFSPGDHYLIPGTNDFRPEILEKMNKIAQGRY